jgi:predicted ATP-grasp superfamily ATP-dependent carboligase
LQVLLTGTEHTGGLAALRALRAAGHEPWVAVTSKAAYGARSRAAAGAVTVPDARTEPEDFAHAIADTAERVGALAVLPGTEGALLALSAHRDLFGDDVAVGVCSPLVTAAATDKVATLAEAAEVGVDVLSAHVLGAPNSVQAEDLRYPLIVKPLRSELPVHGELRRFEARRVDDQDDLTLALAALPDGAGIVQEYVEGRLRTVNGVAWEGEVVAEIHKVGLRTWPAGCGPVSCAETVEVDPALSEQSRALLDRLGWSGVFNLQFIEAEGGCFLIDVNPRLYTSLGLAVAAGMNLPAIWVELLMGVRPRVPEYEVGVRFRTEDDLRSLVHQFRHGARREALAGLRPHRHTAHGIVSLSDPRPGLTYARRIPGRLLPRGGFGARAIPS